MGVNNCERGANSAGWAGIKTDVKNFLEDMNIMVDGWYEGPGRPYVRRLIVEHLSKDRYVVYQTRGLDI